MCGIAGVLGPLGAIDAGVIERMVAALRHRGPDDAGVARLECADRECWLGNTRLSIIDVSPAGHLPMSDERGRHLAYNGEVYGFDGLRRELAAAGERFFSGTDSEVVLRLLGRSGPAALERLRGMFAFGYWDSSTGDLLLARDRAGKKPLYYASIDDGFIFASEVRALLASGLVERRLDLTGLEAYLANGFVVAPLTLVRGVRSLLPGHWMRVGNDGKIRSMASYWRPPGPELASPEQDGIDEARELLREAVELRLVSDVPLGVFLSGGLDSSAIAALMHQSGADVRTFSVTFPETDLDEARFSRPVAAALGTRHTEVPITERAFFEWLPDALAAMDQPTFDGVNTYFVARAAREGGLTVALSGLGADELFGGYPFFRTIPPLIGLAPIASRATSLGSAIRGRLGAPRSLRLAGFWKLAELAGARERVTAAPISLATYQAVQSVFPSWGRQHLLGDAARAASIADGGLEAGLPVEFVNLLAGELAGRVPADATSLLAWRLFLGERVLRDTDQMSMAVSLEVRAPFVDHRFVERVMRFPARLRTAGAPDKPFERRLAEPVLAGIWQPRAKQGFVVPFERWLGGPAGEAMVAETVRDTGAISASGLRPAGVRALWELHRHQPARVPWSRVWAIHALVRWCQRAAMTP